MPDYPQNWENLERTLRSDIETQIAALINAVQALNAIAGQTNAAINADPATAIKGVAAGVRLCARQLVRLTRVASGAFDSPNIGT